MKSLYSMVRKIEGGSMLVPNDDLINVYDDCYLAAGDKIVFTDSKFCGMEYNCNIPLEMSCFVTTTSQPNLIEEVKKLSPKEGDILFVKTISKWSFNEYTNMREELDRAGFNKVLLFVGKEQDLSVLDEKEMEQYGWVKKQRRRGPEFL